MILGIGTDIINIKRIDHVLERHGERFLRRVFTVKECQKADRMVKAKKVAAYAKRFAAKEACAKALGVGIGQGASWKDIEVINLPTGQPTIILTGRASERLRIMTPSGMKAQIHLSLSDETLLAQAFVIISAIPEMVMKGF